LFNKNKTTQQRELTSFALYELYRTNTDHKQ